MTFGLDEELAGLGFGHMKLLDGEGPIGLPEDGPPHEGRPARDVVSGGRDAVHAGGAAAGDPSPGENARLGGAPKNRARDGGSEEHHLRRKDRDRLRRCVELQLNGGECEGNSSYLDRR